MRSKAAFAYVATDHTRDHCARRVGFHESYPEALRLYTEGSAWFSFDDHQVGSITEGKYADLSMLNADYPAVSDNAIRKIQSVLTLVGGRVVDAAAPFTSLKR